MNLGKFEIVGDLRSLKSLNLTRTGIKEFPWPSSSIINLEKVILKGCEELTNVAWCIFELQHLQHLDLSECDNLVTFPTKTSSEFSAANSNSNSNVVHYAPLFVDLSGCNNLREISEFPREIHRLDASLCPSLIRISKLTNILEGKEESMIPRMNLFGCFFLMINYGFKIKMKKKKNLPDNLGVTALLCLFLSSSCLQSEFQVSCFAGVKIPEWFTYRMDCKKLLWPEDFSEKEFRALQFRIRFPGNFKWENNLGGLAFCAQIDRYDSMDDAPFFRLLCTIYINGDVCIIHEHLEQDWWFLPGHMWLYYVPFATIMRRLSESRLPPPSIVNFEIEYKLGMGSCGVHVVMQEEEEEEEEGGIFVSCSLSEDGSSATIDVLS
ncbi:hypothetical protein M0R45_007367 [Rubus argutus]|uniref:Uncharacterized protein n=1 Tax=Rubus argutus TaxID=59490 RepID=A0AAW1Y0Y2_RUBAR